jgi:hypothetical protein
VRQVQSIVLLIDCINPLPPLQVQSIVLLIDCTHLLPPCRATGAVYSAVNRLYSSTTPTTGAGCAGASIAPRTVRGCVTEGLLSTCATSAQTAPPASPRGTPAGRKRPLLTQVWCTPSLCTVLMRPLLTQAAPTAATPALGGAGTI